MTSEARKKSNTKYRAESLDRIEFTVPKGHRDVIKAHAARYQPMDGVPGRVGYSPKGSVTAFLQRAVQETMDRDVINTTNDKRKVGFLRNLVNLDDSLYTRIL